MSDPRIAARRPAVIELAAGRYAYCSCGQSAKQPFCDGSHKGTSFAPQKFTAESTGTFNLCGCKNSDDKPFCDGAHNLL